MQLSLPLNSLSIFLRWRTRCFLVSLQINSNLQTNFSWLTCIEHSLHFQICTLHKMSRYKATCKFKYENDADMLMQVNIVRMDLWTQHLRKNDFRCHIISLCIFNACRDRERNIIHGMGITPNSTFKSKLTKWKIHSIICTTELPAKDDEF